MAMVRINGEGNGREAQGRKAWECLIRIPTFSTAHIFLGMHKTYR